MSTTLIDAESTLTDRYQTTVPEPVRLALKLGKRDKIYYRIQRSGEVVIGRVRAPEGDDPALGNFLEFLTRDLSAHPEHLRAIDPALVQRARALVAGVNVDLEAPLAAEDE